MEAQCRILLVLMICLGSSSSFAFHIVPTDEPSVKHTIEDLFHVRFGVKEIPGKIFPPSSLPQSSVGPSTAAKFRNDRENELVPSSHRQLDKPPGLFLDPRPFEPLSPHHHNPTVFNFPSFTTVVDSPNFFPGSQTNDSPLNSFFNQNTNNNSFRSSIGQPQLQVIEQDNTQPNINNNPSVFAVNSPVTQIEDQRFPTNFFTQSSPFNDDPFESLSNLVKGVESSQPSFESLLADTSPNFPRTAQNFPPPPSFTPDEPSTESPLFPFDIFPDPNNPSDPPIFPPSTGGPPAPPSPFPSQPSFPPDNSSPVPPFGTVTSPAPPPVPFDPTFGSGGGAGSGGGSGSGGGFGSGDDSPFPFDPTFPGPPAPKRFQPEVGGSCIAFTGERGLCLGMENCPALRPLVKQLHNKELLVVLLNNVCRFDNGEVFFCCEYPAFQPGELQLADTRQPAFVRSPHGAPVPLERECGRKPRRAKIIGGEDTEEGEWPWLVAVGRPDTNKRFVVDCGGTLITRRHVITAANCFLFPEFFQPTHARIGEHDFNRLDARPHEDFVIVGRNEPGFLAPTTQNNLMIVTLGEDVTFTDYVRPICLPPADSTMPRPRSIVTLAGWGLNRAPDDLDSDLDRPEETQTPKHIEQEVSSIEDCQEAYSDPTSNFRVIDHRNICIRRADISGVCVGDTGGPIVQLQSADSYALVGVISTSAGCLDRRLPTLGTKIEPYLEWILYVIQGDEAEGRNTWG